MLWRVRTTLPDRPGALALLAEQCGAAEINILGLQIFPGVEAVTDELVLRTPPDWTPRQIARLVESAGGTSVVAAPCSEAALADQPTRYVQAARAILDHPTSFPRVVARLFDAGAQDDGPGDLDVMEMTVGEVQVQVRRRAAFSATEHARAAALAALVSDVLRRRPPASGPTVTEGAPEFVAAGDTVSALVDGVVVGIATVHEPTADDAVRGLTLRVDVDWQRRGIGTRLLLDAGRLAHDRGADELLLTTRSDNPAVLPMVLAAGLRGRIRMAGDELTVRVPVRDLRPLRA
jgi:ribosomal protein S18 acetylase RimI-like enzyme